MKEKYITPKEFAGMIGRSDQTIRRWIAEGIIVAIKLNGRLLIPLSEIDRLIKEAVRMEE